MPQVKQPLPAINLDNLDVYFIIDQSGSMDERVGKCASGVTPGSAEDRRLSRYKYCEETIIPFANELATHDDDGITFTFFNRSYKLHDNVKAHDIAGHFASHKPGGGTDLTAPLTEVLGLMVKRSDEKQQFACLMTDGAPDNEQTVTDAIIAATKKIDGDGKLCILILKVGDDPKAEQFLTRLDTDLKRYGAKYDIVAVKHIDEIAGRAIADVVLEAFNN